jgi:hypothetical protein
MLGAIFFAGTATFALFADKIIERGSSFRIELWQLTLGRIAEHPWIGHGYNAKLTLDPGVGYSLQEPHSFALGVLYYVGIIGLLPWLFFLAWGFISSWRHRVQPLFIIASAWLAFGIGAGLTEGGGIISRPKEHWFLLWIPLALIAALSINQRARRLLDMPIKTKTPTALQQLTADAQVIEEDGLGPKVLRLTDGSFLKLFRRRRWYTSGSFTPYSDRFAVNSVNCATCIPSHILGLYRFEDGSTAVLLPVAGQHATPDPARHHCPGGAPGTGGAFRQIHGSTAPARGLLPLPAPGQCAGTGGRRVRPDRPGRPANLPFIIEPFPASA